MSARSSYIVLASLAALASGCGDDPATTTDTATAATDATTTGDSSDAVVEPVEPFAFGLALGQPMSAGPFPSDVLRDDDGHIVVGALKDDPRYGTLAKAPILERTSAQLAGRTGFGFESAVYFPMNVEPDLASLEGNIRYVALGGPESGAVFAGQAFWFAPARLLGVMPAWGHYLVPGGTYAVVIGTGGKTAAGDPIAASADFEAVMAVDAPAAASADMTRARSIFAGLRDFLATRDEAAVMATVFTTEPTMDYLGDLLAGARAFELVTPTRRVRSTSGAALTWETAEDVHGETALADYFGVATAPFASTPGGWSASLRAQAAAYTSDQAPYKGGSFAGYIGWVINGSIVAPSYNLAHDAAGNVTSAPIEWKDGAPVLRSRVMVPFTLFLCRRGPSDDTLPTAPVKVAIFTHGGTAQRSDALAFANLNCTSDVATIAMDLPFHSGRQTVHYFADEDLVVPTHPDAVDVFKTENAAGRTQDYIGDNGGATVTVGSFFALDKDLDPLIMEANHLAVAVETDTLVRYLKAEGATGLGQALGLTFDTSALVHESLSFGTSFGSAFLAGNDDVKGAIVSVGSGMMVSVNLPMAPNNANLAANLFDSVMDLKSTVPEIVSGAYKDPMVSLVQFLAERGDPLGYAPFVLRHRVSAHPLHILGFGDSWDETLFSPAQLSFGAALGVPVFEREGWVIDGAIPGASDLGATPYPATAPKDNVTYGERTQSAGYFYFPKACHAEVVLPLCSSHYEPPYPPPTARTEDLVFASPICAMQKAMAGFVGDLVAGASPAISAPPTPSASDCADLYE